MTILKATLKERKTALCRVKVHKELSEIFSILNTSIVYKLRATEECSAALDISSKRAKLLNADWSKQRTIFLICLFYRLQNYSLLIGRAAKILAPDWLSTLFLHLVSH